MHELSIIQMWYKLNAPVHAKPQGAYQGILTGFSWNFQGILT